MGVLTGKKDKLTSHIDGKSVRGYPTIMDISAVMVGEHQKYTHYQGYQKQVKKLKKEILTEKSLYGYDFKIYTQLLKDNKINSFKGY